MARHERTAEWLDSMAADRVTDLAEVLAHHRYTAHEIARTLGLDAGRYAPAARDALHRAARRAYALHALDTAAGHIGRALALFEGEPVDASTARERLCLELLATEIAFYADAEAFLSGGGEDQLVTLAERLYAAGEHGPAARAWTLLGQVAWLRADRRAALSCLDRAVELCDELPDVREKAEAYAELGRLHMLNYEHDPAIAAATAAAEIADRLGLSEVAANARITIGIARYGAGDRTGLDDLRDLAELSRSHGPLTLSRAIQNLAYAIREEGDWPGSQTRMAELPADAPGAHNVMTGYSAEAMRAYFAGDWDRLVSAATAFLSSPGWEWDLQVPGLCAVVRLLRDEHVGCAEPDEIEAILDHGRRSGFHRPQWTALAYVALCRSLQGNPAGTVELLTELADSWRAVRAVVSGEWIAAAAHAAALAGREASAVLHDMLAEVSHRTPWVEAALRTVAGAVAAADGDTRRAAALHLAAADLFGGIPNVTERVLALAAALRTLGPEAKAEPHHDELVAFATRMRAPRLLELAGLAQLAT